MANAQDSSTDSMVIDMTVPGFSVSVWNYYHNRRRKKHCVIIKPTCTEPGRIQGYVATIDYPMAGTLPLVFESRRTANNYKKAIKLLENIECPDNIATAPVTSVMNVVDWRYQDVYFVSSNLSLRDRIRIILKHLRKEDVKECI